MADKQKLIRIALIIAIVIVSLGIVTQRGGIRSGVRDPGEWVPVIVTRRYVPALRNLSKEDLRVQDYPRAFVPPGALNDKDEFVNEFQQKRFSAAVAIPEGHPVTRALLFDTAQPDALGSLIRPGKAAVSFEVDRAHGVGGWVKPGDTIAVFGLTPLKKSNLLFPSLVVLAIDETRIGHTLEKAAEPLLADGSSIITVLASPHEAATLIRVREEGMLTVVLRSPGDDLPWPTQN